MRDAASRIATWNVPSPPAPPWSLEQVYQAAKRGCDGSVLRELCCGCGLGLRGDSWALTGERVTGPRWAPVLPSGPVSKVRAGRRLRGSRDWAGSFWSEHSIRLLRSSTLTDRRAMLRNISDDVYKFLKGRSWGLLVIVLIGLAVGLFAIWATLTPGQKERIIGSAAPEQPGPRSGPADRNAPFSDEDLGLRNLVIYTCRGVSEPRKLYEAARGLEPSQGRDTEFASIVVDAVCVGDESLAFEILAKLQAVDQKDRAAKAVTAFYLDKKKFADATRWAAFMSNPQDRAWWIHRILEISQRQR